MHTPVCPAVSESAAQQELEESLAQAEKQLVSRQERLARRDANADANDDPLVDVPPVPARSSPRSSHSACSCAFFEPGSFEFESCYRTFTVAGDEFSWILPTLGLWFSSLLSRDEQDRTWLNSARPVCYWLTGFFNPQGMLTAMKQEVTRKHKADKWALDEVDYRTEVTTMERVDQCRAAPPEGVYVHGLFLDGAALDNKQGLLVESVPKTLIVPLPVLFVSGLVRHEAVKRQIELFGKQV